MVDVARGILGRLWLALHAVGVELLGLELPEPDDHLAHVAAELLLGDEDHVLVAAGDRGFYGRKR